MAAPAPDAGLVRLRCVMEGKRLRVRVAHPRYSGLANCQFSRNLRADGREFLVPPEDITLAPTPSGLFFYRVKHARAIVCDPGQAELVVYGADNTECVVCMVEAVDGLIIFAPCGHQYCCGDCASQLEVCPMCRAPVVRRVRPEELQR